MNDRGSNNRSNIMQKDVSISSIFSWANWWCWFSRGLGDGIPPLGSACPSCSSSIFPCTFALARVPLSLILSPLLSTASKTWIILVCLPLLFLALTLPAAKYALSSITISVYLPIFYTLTDIFLTPFQLTAIVFNFVTQLSWVVYFSLIIYH